jgi:hypothetical protein
MQMEIKPQQILSACVQINVVGLFPAFPSLPSTDAPGRRLLLDCYSGIDDPDFFYGVPQSAADDLEGRLQRYSHEGQWHRRLGLSDTLLASTSMGGVIILYLSCHCI